MTKTILNLLTVLVLLVPLTSSAADNIHRAQFTTQVSDREPVDNISSLENTFTSVYFFTDIRDCIGCKVEHVWSLNGKHVYTHKGTAKYARYRWWSKKTLTDDMIGSWSVDVKVNGKVGIRKKLTYFKPSTAQQQTAPIEKRLLKQNVNQCEERLKYFSQKNDEDPTDPYFKFMLQKWGSRCYGE